MNLNPSLALPRTWHFEVSAHCQEQGPDALLRDSKGSHVVNLYLHRVTILFKDPLSALNIAPVSRCEEFRHILNHDHVGVQLDRELREVDEQRVPTVNMSS